MTYILVVDDERTWPRFWEGIVPDGVEILHAWDPIKARNVYDAQRDEIEIIAIDGMMHGPISNNVVFIRHVRESGYVKLILAASANWKHNRTMLAAGCDSEIQHKVPSKTELREIAPHLFTA